MDFAEKRDFQRMAMDCSLQFSVADNPQKLEGEVINLSAKGILFVCADEITPGASVEIKLTPVSDITPPMTASTRVARCEKQGEDNYHIAAEIVQIL